MLRKLARILAISPAIWLSAAHALGLGEIDVNSHLNQRFSATIPLTAIRAEDTDNVLVRLADNDDFAKAGIERADYLSSLTFQVVADPQNPRIVISSKQLAREPFLNFLLDVRTSSGRVLRQYTVLLDPPAYGQSAPAAVTAPTAKAPSDFYQTAEESNQGKPAAPAPTPAPEVVAPAKPAKAAKPAPTPTAAPATDTSGTADAASTYGPVKAQETFWSIATKLRPNPSVSMDQMLWALYNNNPKAFEGGRISGLLKGSTLKVPALSDITAVSPEAAKQHLQELNGHRAASAKAKTKAKKVPAEQIAEPAEAVVPKAEPAAPAPAAKPATPPAAEKKTLEPVAPPPAPAAKPAPAPAPAKPATPPPAAAVAPAPEPAAAAPATPPADSATAATQTEPTAAPAAAPVEPAPEPVIPKPAKPAEDHSSSLLDDWMLPAVAGAIVLILALLGVRFWQKKNEGNTKPGSAPALTPKASRNLQFWKRAAEAAPTFQKPPPPPPPAFATRAPAVPPPPLPKAAPVDDSLAETKVASFADSPGSTQKLPKQSWENTSTLNDTTQLPSFDSTQIFEGDADDLSKTLGPDAVDFDITGKFEAETLKVDLDTNDPVSEADFHLAYGLYDEAALLLENAAEKNPGRTDIRVKLAETYFRASKPHEFDDVAQSLKSQLDASEWQKIAIMGSQLLPDSPLYKGALSEASLGNDVVDLGFDEPADLTATTHSPVPAAKTISPTATIPPSGRSNASVLDFKLEDLEAPHLAPQPKVEAPVSTGNTLEFNLSEFDLSKPGAAEPAPAVTAPKTATAAAKPAADDHSLEFDLGSFDASPAEQTHHAAASTAHAEEISLDDFDLGELSDDSHAISAGDEAGTKLDLARAYVDMGDNDMARSLLNEVLTQGSDEQKTEAQTLIQRLA